MSEKWIEVQACPMCGRPILDDNETHVMTVTYNPASLSPEQVQDCIKRGWFKSMFPCKITRGVREDV